MRNAGSDTTILGIYFAFLAEGMIVVSPGRAPSQFGAVGMSSKEGTGKFDPEDKLGVLKDELGIRSAHALARRVVEISRMLKAGREALKET